jgi:membrane-bound metal-dependent hydrolase YbcI (DUF457 family)
VRSWSRGALVTLVGLVLIILMTLAAVGVVWFLYPQNEAVRWSAVSAVASIGTLAIASTAAIVATVAYRMSVLRPRLLLEIWLRLPENYVARAEDPLAFEFERATTKRWPGARAVEGMRPLLSRSLALRVENDGLVSAKNISVRIVLTRLAWHFDKVPAGWRPDPITVDRTWGTQALVWEGGVDSVIHAGDDRWFELEFRGLWASASAMYSHPEVSVSLVADGFPKKSTRFRVALG